MQSAWSEMSDGHIDESRHLLRKHWRITCLARWEVMLGRTCRTTEGAETQEGDVRRSSLPFTLDMIDIHTSVYLCTNDTGLGLLTQYGWV